MADHGEAGPTTCRAPNIAKAGLQLPAVKDYEQVDREIIGDAAADQGLVRGCSRVAIICLIIGGTAWAYQIHEGLGVAGYNPPVMWGVYIVTFVFWIGIGHAGTLISAILYLFRAGFRTTIYRCAEAMTVFAVMTAGLFPILHLGRPWKFFWLIPYPNWRLIWPQFKSPLVWDVFAISTYLTISTTFLFIGLIPDIATLRDAEKNPIKQGDLLGALVRVAELRARSGGTSPARTCSSPRSRRRSCSPCTRSCRSTSRWRWCPAGTRRSSRPTSSRARSSRAWGWSSRSSSRSASSSSSSITSR